MKKGILLVMFALLSLAGFSQVSWNAKVGMNISNFTGDLDVSAKVGVKLAPASAMTAALPTTTIGS